MQKIIADHNRGADATTKTTKLSYSAIAPRIEEPKEIVIDSVNAIYCSDVSERINNYTLLLGRSPPRNSFGSTLGAVGQAMLYITYVSVVLLGRAKAHSTYG